MAEPIPPELEERIAYYETNDAGPFTSYEWTVLLLTGVALPVVCLLLAWTVGWNS